MKIHKGFTLIELLVVVAIIGMTMSIGLPSFRSIILNSRLTNAANSMVSALQIARTEALKTHHDVYIRGNTSDWRDGWFVFADLNSDGSQDETTEPNIAVFDKLSPTLAVKNTLASATDVHYDPSGRFHSSIAITETSSGGIDTSQGTFSFCSSGTDADFRSVIVQLTGRVSIALKSASLTYENQCG